MFFFFNDTATTEIYTLSLHDALPISKTARAVELPHRDQVEEVHPGAEVRDRAPHPDARETIDDIGRERGAHSPERTGERSEEHTSELQSPCNLVCRLLLEKKKKTNHH